MLEPTGLVEAGRRAYAAADWSAALENLTAARAEGPIAVDDVALMARSAWWLGRVPESLAFAEETFRSLCDAGRTADAAMTALRLSLLWATRGDVTVGMAWLNRARRILADEPEGRAHGYLLYIDAALEMAAGGGAWTDAGVERLADFARRYPEPGIQSLSMVVAGLAALRRGDTHGGFALLDEAMLPVLAGEIEAEWAGDIYCTIIHVSHELADFRRMEDWTRATETWCRQFGSEAIYTGICRVHRLELRCLRGEWHEAETMLEHESTCLAGDNAWVAGEGFYQLGEIRRLRGDADGAREAYDLARAAGIDPQPGDALLALTTGDVAAAGAAIAASLAQRDRVARVRLLLAAVQIALAAGDRAGAGVFADELRESAEHFESRGFRCWSAQADGMLALADADASGALAALQRAEADLRADNRPYELARVLGLTARAYDLAGSESAAVAARTRAREILTRLGARADPDATPRAAEAGTSGPLTAREAEVLALVSSGASNRDVAERLFISEKTVGRHLANVYVKIGVGSRTAAAAWWHARPSNKPDLR
ncbi:helix-turn-helix transcriptional regulator [Microbacterium sp. 2FI]|uniref:helix-turn-helix domain-containing protein n=1 Tax=Microbacterium sp. 2FI TaxID=2502193 RepID=UPI0010F7B1B6|nr:helix-turn-helix transcriptional regulator [Microbacterium sp. 2FI]